ncbi:hypothetical protein KI688_007276 [Linnemannia hyalina]|uniref:Uncharacterized protein n=1 Tax=Linnemannia hyalina TaxID=64524 RepID=A0A9P7XHU4_9FUNG|nr:hypothetical protein KI688_007276 [Linnemannia hyalina]
MSKRPADQTLENPSAQMVKINYADGDDQLVSDGDSLVTSDSDIDSAVDDMTTFPGEGMTLADDRCVSLNTRLILKLFGDRSTKHEARAAEYIANMWQSPSPIPTVEGYLNFISEMYPSAPQSGVARSWNKLKKYFSGEENTNLADIQDLINISETPATSTNISPPLRRVSVPEATYSALRLRTTSNRSKGNRISNSSDSNSTNNNGTNSNSSNSRSSTISGGQLSPATILKMQTLFRKNFVEFGGNVWKLPSGVILDNLLAAHVERLPYESALRRHGGSAAGDGREGPSILLVDRPKKQLPALSTPEKAFLKKYNLLPDDLRNLLAASS